jgi:L-threonylcarbamoyladenylate synthase
VTRILPADGESIHEAAAILRGGGLVVFPTETVYGLGAAADNETAVRAMFAAKGRPADHPVIVHVADISQLDQVATAVPAIARQLADAFWPGPLTLVVRRADRISRLVTGGLDTIGVRVPAHPIAHALLREFGGPVAAPSANRFGRVSATTAEHVAEELTGRVDLILDGGACPVGLESTIVDVSSGPTAILRPGAVTAEQIAAVLDTPISGPGRSTPRVSGSLPSHYAPRARVEIVDEEQLPLRAGVLAREGKKVAVLSRQWLPIAGPNIVVLAVPEIDDDLARLLYAILRRVDELGCDVALTSLPSEQGLGTAIADRLRRAAGPRNATE